MAYDGHCHVRITRNLKQKYFPYILPIMFELGELLIHQNCWNLLNFMVFAVYFIATL